MLHAPRAVRLGLRAASRNPELAFAKGLVDSFGTLLALLPPATAVLALFGPLNIPRLLRFARALPITVAGGVLCALLLAFIAGLFFWAGAVPVLAADIEVDRRPPSGNFILLASRGFERVLRAGAVAWALPLLFSLALGAVLAAALPLAFLRRSPLLLAAVALLAALSLLGALLLDLLARLVLIRSAAFAEGVSAAFGKAVSLCGARLGTCLLVSAAYLLLELIAASVAGLCTGAVSSASFLEPRIEALALAPRAAVGLAFAAVFAWLEVGRMGSYAAIVLDGEGLIASEPEPSRPPPAPLAELVIEALPVEDDPT